MIILPLSTSHVPPSNAVASGRASHDVRRLQGNLPHVGGLG